TASKKVNLQNIDSTNSEGDGINAKNIDTVLKDLSIIVEGLLNSRTDTFGKSAFKGTECSWDHSQRDESRINTQADGLETARSELYHVIEKTDHRYKELQNSVGILELSLESVLADDSDFWLEELAWQGRDDRTLWKQQERNIMGKENMKLRSILRQRSAQLGECNANVASIQERMNELLNVCVDMKTRFLLYEHYIEQNRLDSEPWKKEIGRLEYVNEGLKTELKKIKKNLLSLENKLDNTEKDKSELSADLGITLKKLNMIKDELSQSHDKNNNLQLLYDNVNNEVDSLKKSVRSLRRKKLLVTEKRDHLELAYSATKEKLEKEQREKKLLGEKIQQLQKDKCDMEKNMKQNIGTLMSLSFVSAQQKEKLSIMGKQQNMAEMKNCELEDQCSTLKKE
uniref:Nucleoprotein TPR-like n=1 Tax=Saccoglossus kowalevskii TaxID=10224 RepID=A0ABM0M9P5_SACKO